MAAPISVKRQCLLLFAKKILVVKEHNNLYLGLVTPSTGLYSPNIPLAMLETSSTFSVTIFVLSFSFESFSVYFGNFQLIKFHFNYFSGTHFFFILIIDFTFRELFKFQFYFTILEPIFHAKFLHFYGCFHFKK